MVGPTVVLMEEQQPEPGSEVIEPGRVWTWPRTTPPGVALGELFGNLACWKSAHGRETLPPLQARRRDLCSAGAAAAGPANSTANSTADGPANDPADGAANSTADGPANDPAGGTPDCALDGAPDDVLDGAPGGAADGSSGGGASCAGAGGGAAVGGSMLDWLEVSADAAQRALGEPTWRHGGEGLGARWGSSAGCGTLSSVSRWRWPGRSGSRGRATRVACRWWTGSSTRPGRPRRNRRSST